MQYVAMVGFEGGYYVLLGDDNGVIGFDSLRRGLDYFERAYNDNHSRGYEKSMSACLNFIAFQPKVVGIKNVRDLADRIVGSSQSVATQLSHISGYYNTIECKADGAPEAYAKGRTPALIN